MFTMPYFKQIIKSSYKMFILFTAILCLYMTIVCSVFTPQTMDELAVLGQSMGAMGSMFGEMNSLMNFLGEAFYGMIAFIFPMIYCIIIGNKLIASQIDRGYMAYYLSTPTSRNKISITSAIFFILSIILMFGILFFLGIAMSNVFQPGSLDIDKFFMLTLGSFLFTFAISSICFASSCIFNLSKNSLTFGAGIPIVFFLCKMVSELSKDTEFFKYFTLSSLFNPKDVLNGESVIWQYLILFAVGVILYCVGIKVFKEKDLPL